MDVGGCHALPMMLPIELLGQRIRKTSPLDLTSACYPKCKRVKQKITVASGTRRQAEGLTEEKAIEVVTANQERIEGERAYGSPAPSCCPCFLLSAAHRIQLVHCSLLDLQFRWWH